MRPNAIYSIFHQLYSPPFSNENLSQIWLFIDLVACAPKIVLQSRSVAPALTNQVWIIYIHGGLSLEGSIQYLQVWNTLESFVLSHDEHQHFWRHERSGTFTSNLLIGPSFMGP
jgi:hypothetical protein